MSMNDVEPRQYPMVIRELIRHENDVTNHRIMWLLIGQGLFFNAFVGAGSERGSIVSVLAPLGILVALSAFVTLYKSYQARGYLQFLGSDAKRGTLPEEALPLFGWPKQRVTGWRKTVWICPWVGQIRDLLEPFFFLPGLLVFTWLFVLLRHWRLSMRVEMLLGLCLVLVVVIMFLFCLLWVWWERKDERLPRASAV